MQSFAVVSTQTAGVLQKYVRTPPPPSARASPSWRTSSPPRSSRPTPSLALEQEITDIRNEAREYGSLRQVPSAMQANVRNQMYLTSETFRLLPKAAGSPKFSAADTKTIIRTTTASSTTSTKFIPTWVKVAVALALGLGTMVGWKRIVITVGEKIGKTHLTYAQGAAAEIIAMATISARTALARPSAPPTSSAPASPAPWPPTAAACSSRPIRNIALAWIFTLPAAALLSAGLFYLFNMLAR